MQVSQVTVSVLGTVGCWEASLASGSTSCPPWVYRHCQCGLGGGRIAPNEHATFKQTCDIWEMSWINGTYWQVKKRALTVTWTWNCYNLSDNERAIRGGKTRDPSKAPYHFQENQIPTLRKGNPLVLLCLNFWGILSFLQQVLTFFFFGGLGEIRAGPEFLWNKVSSEFKFLFLLVRTGHLFLFSSQQANFPSFFRRWSGPSSGIWAWGRRQTAPVGSWSHRLSSSVTWDSCLSSCPNGSTFLLPS